jgi:hypothetical protein
VEFDTQQGNVSVPEFGPTTVIAGHVSDAYGNPIPGALVSIEARGLTDTTNPFGGYAFVNGTYPDGARPGKDDTLTVQHDMYLPDTVSLAGCTTDIDLQLQYNPDSLVLHGEPMRIIKPAGGETYHYGDTIQMIWMFDSDSTDQMVMSFASAPPIFYYEYIEDELDYIQWPEDTAQDSDNAAELTLIEDNPKRVLVRYPIAVKDTVVGFGVINFEDSLSIKVWDPYGQEGGCRSCQEGVFIDSPIYISREQ